MIKVLVAGTANPHMPGYLRRFAESFRKNDLYQFIAIADHDAGRLANDQTILKDIPVKYYLSWKEMIDRHPEAEAIIIGTDNPEHIHVFRYAVQKHLHIYMMKVISTSEAECREMLEMEKTYDRVIQVELELHFSPQFRDARELVQSGRLGKLRSIYVSNISQSPCNYFPNWGTPELSWGERIPVRPGSKTCRGGGLTDHPHPIDMVRWVTGHEFATVHAVCARNQRDYLEVEDNIILCGELDDGTKYMINPSYAHLEEHVPVRRLLWPKALECNLKLNGEKGFYTCDYNTHPLYVVGKGHASPDRLMLDGCPGYPGVNGRGMFDLFCDCINGKLDKPEVTLDNSYQAVRVMNAAYESAYSGKTVRLRS